MIDCSFNEAKGRHYNAGEGVADFWRRLRHLHGGEFLQHHAWHKAGRQASKFLAQGDRQSVGEERDEEVRLDPRGFVVKDGPQAEVAPQVSERLLDVGELHGATPDKRGIVGGEIGAEQTAAFAPAHRAQGVTVEPIRQAAVVTDGDYNERFRDPAGAQFA